MARTYKKLKKLDSIVCYLRKKLPLDKPFYYKRVKLQDIDGDCNSYKRCYKIRIDKGINEDAAIECVLHEVAHCLTPWDKEPDDHGPLWGKNYSLVYRTFLEWHDNK